MTRASVWGWAVLGIVLTADAPGAESAGPVAIVAAAQAEPAE